MSLPDVTFELELHVWLELCPGPRWGAEVAPRPSN